MRGAQSLLIRAQLGGEGGKVITVNGRAAWALDQLHKAGDRGLTPVSHPAPRWSHYVWLLRAEGVVIETVDEPHAGAFAGTHARYILRTPVVVLERSGATAPPPAPLPAGAPLEYRRGA
ncbi:MAG: hypothetical protein B7X99_12150 [Rhizobiales bacterium 17-65-6]|nr:MAG: hypothetical protein B7Z30_00610 [Rhizobiales bacterium 12-68-15]OYZ98253.1 MAG: hypothetical protein B7X99_12150 [Rhizobiales bacterium 17-65-6]